MSFGFRLQAAAFVLAIVGLSWMVSKLSLQWGVEVTYFFVVGTVAYALVSFLVLKRPVHNEAIELILASYLLVEVCILITLKVIVHTGPLLSRRGWWCCCTEHLRLIDWSSNCVIYSRYNDGSGD